MVSCEIPTQRSRLNSPQVVTLVGLIYLPKRLDIWNSTMEVEDENMQLLKQAGTMKRRRMTRKNH